MPDKKHTRITADFDKRSYDCLTEVSAAMHANKAESLRKSLQLTQFIIEQQADGKRIIIEDQNGDNRKEILPFF